METKAQEGELGQLGASTTDRGKALGGVAIFFLLYMLVVGLVPTAYYVASHGGIFARRAIAPTATDASAESFEFKFSP